MDAPSYESNNRHDETGWVPQHVMGPKRHAALMSSIEGNCLIHIDPLNDNWTASWGWQQDLLSKAAHPARM